jgi:hypothetical protein
MKALWELDPSILPGPLRKLGEKELHLWLTPWLRQRSKRLFSRRHSQARHLLFCVCDHYEPLHGQETLAGGGPVSAEA